MIISGLPSDCMGSPEVDIFSSIDTLLPSLTVDGLGSLHQLPKKLISNSEESGSGLDGGGGDEVDASVVLGGETTIACLHITKYQYKLSPPYNI